MRTLVLSAMLAAVFCGEALAWGQEGHSIVAEIAQRRLSPEAARAAEQLLGRGHSLASIASWADDVRALGNLQLALCQYPAGGAQIQCGP